MKNAAMSLPAAEAEIDRYITLPGQATTYKIGERAIRNLRAQYEKELEEFDLKKFHSAVLNCFGPLQSLKSCVDLYFTIKT